ncbi:MAG: helix-turn-helix transcriptional regulator [Clostridia bacterium]|nr:helix-turn-helix transcriptional regulator [Clostridia bacterium]
MKIGYISSKKFSLLKTTNIHSHDSFEIMYYYAVNGNFRYKDKKSDEMLSVKISDNTLIILPPKLPHVVEHESAYDLTALSFSITDGDALYSSLNALDAPIVIKDETGKYCDCFNKIETEYAGRKPFFEDMINGCVLRIISYALDLGEEKIDSSISNAKRFIDDNFTDGIDVLSLSAHSGYSYSHFCALFKKAYGAPPKEYILKKRLLLSKKLLKETAFQIGEISERCGFTDQYSFTHYFTRHTGISPKAYRNSKQIK